MKENPMALNVTEATAVNRLYEWLAGSSPENTEEAREALATLAHSAHRTLMAGVTQQQVRQTWRTLNTPGTPRRRADARKAGI
jgi:hypothetical protein